MKDILSFHMNLTDLGAFADGPQRCPHTSLLLLQKLLPELGSWVQKLETWDWIQKGRDKAFTMTSSSARWKTRLWPRANQAAVSAQNNGKGEAKTGRVGILDLYVNKDSNLSSVPSWLVSVLLGSIAHWSAQTTKRRQVSRTPTLACVCDWTSLYLLHFKNGATGSSLMFLSGLLSKLSRYDHCGTLSLLFCPPSFGWLS